MGTKESNLREKRGELRDRDLVGLDTIGLAKDDVWEMRI